MSDISAGTATASKNKQTTDGIFLAFVDAINKPISNLVVKVAVGGDTHELRTDQNGCLPIISFDPNAQEGTVSAVMPTGVEEEVFKFSPAIGVQCHTCKSPYLLLKAETELHVGKATESSKPSPKKPGETENKRDKEGAPVVTVAISKDCPNSDNLKLDDNVIYKQMILDASKQSGIISQAVAALINSEAEFVTKDRDGNVIEKGKNKKVKGKTVKETVTIVTTFVWYERSHNDKTDASGLTQFIPDTWKGLALNPSTHLHKKAVELKYVVNEPVTKTVKRAVKATKHHGVVVPAKPAVTRLADKYVIKHERDLLAMRYDPGMSILTCVDYGLQNIRGLGETFPKIKDLNDSDKAKFFYLAHHLGLGDARKFIHNKIEEEDKPLLKDNKPVLNKKGHAVIIRGAKTLLTAQFKKDDEAKARAKREDGSYILAHRRWLIGYIDLRMVVSNFACDKSKVPSDQSLFDLITNIGGAHPVGFKVKP